MPTYYCPRCAKNLGFGSMFHKSITTQPTGYIVGHIGGNPNLPMMGAPIGGGSRTALCCRMCGEEVNQIPTESERKEMEQKYKEEQAMRWVWLVIGAIIVFFLVLIQL